MTFADSGRLKYLLQVREAVGVVSHTPRLTLNCSQCRSVVVSHKMKWLQHFHTALDADPNSPDQNIVELQGPGWGEVTLSRPSLAYPA